MRGSTLSNLDSFLHCTTPVVPPQCVSKANIRSLNLVWHPCERDSIEYFRLSDLWNSYDEWSAYGAGVPIRLDSGETLVQYYVPYLSAIQIFTSHSSLSGLREDSELGDGELRDSCSDSESESDKLSRWDASSSEEGLEQESILHHEDRFGHLYIQHFERLSPYARVPLVGKVNELARRCPGLKSLNSVDLSPASWMAVAWYPIYHIPMGRTIKDLSTCFLTYHTLSSSFQGVDPEGNVECGEREGMRLPPFGLATYKLQGSVWTSGNHGGRDQERLISLLSTADSWLKQLRVDHHDFNYFTGIRRC